VSFDYDVLSIFDDSNTSDEFDVPGTCDKYDLHASTAFDTCAVFDESSIYEESNALDDSDVSVRSD